MDGAISDFNKAIELQLKEKTVYLERGNARSSQGDVDGAILDYTQALEMDPNFLLAYIRRGQARSAKRDVEGRSPITAGPLNSIPRMLSLTGDAAWPKKPREIRNDPWRTSPAPSNWIRKSGEATAIAPPARCCCAAGRKLSRITGAPSS